MQYNKKKHLELLKKSNESLSIDSTCFIADENSLELLSYSIMMVSHFHWENRYEYFKLIEKLLNGPISFEDLTEKYEAINKAVEALQAELIVLEPDPKSEGFVDLIDQLVAAWDEYYENNYCLDPLDRDPDLSESQEFSEEELKKFIQNIFIQMKDGYP
jgi:hypothetical protein